MKSPLLAALTFSLTLPALAASNALVPQPPVELVGTQGKFDFIKVDSANHRLLACHTGNGSLDVIDLATTKLLKSIPTGAAQGVAIDAKGGRYFVSTSNPPKMIIVDAAKLEITGEVPLPGPADLVAYHPGSNRVFVCNDKNPKVWIVEPLSKTLWGTLVFRGAGMEDLAFDSSDGHLYQCLKESSQLCKINAHTGKILAIWPTAPAENPHGLAMIPGTNSVLVVGGTGKLSLISLDSGKVLSSCDVSPKIDELAYDPGLHRAYGASGLGTVSVVDVGADKLTAQPPIPTSPGAHSIAVDPQTHTAWIAFAKDGKAYIQAFTEK